MGVQVRNSVGETAIATARLTVSLRRSAAVSGYVQLCGGPAPGRCHVSTLRVCQALEGCVRTDRVEALDARPADVMLAVDGSDEETAAAASSGLTSGDSR